MRISVEGNLGAGKSAVMAALATATAMPPGVDGALPATLAVRPEPVDDWNLDAYYADPAAHALTFQLRVLLSFCDAPDPCVSERSPSACRHVFGQLLANDGTLGSEQWALFKDCHAELGWEPDAIVYLDCPAALCEERVRARGRAAEAGVDALFLRQVEFQYETLLKYARVPVVRVDATRDRATVAAEVVGAVRRLLTK